jgi:Berberine and berberine like
MEYLEAIPTPFSQINGWAMGGAVSRVDGAATAVGEREVGVDVSLAVGWEPGDPDADAHVAWSRAGWEALRPHSTGFYANFISDEGAAGVEAAYGERLARLSALKAAWDPDNVFHRNANIPVAEGALR